MALDEQGIGIGAKEDDIYIPEVSANAGEATISTLELRVRAVNVYGQTTTLSQSLHWAFVNIL